MCDPDDDDCPFDPHHNDGHGQDQSRIAEATRKRHQEAKTDEQHHLDVFGYWGKNKVLY